MPRHHFPCNFGMHRVGVIEQRWTEKRKACVQQKPEAGDREDSHHVIVSVKTLIVSAGFPGSRAMAPDAAAGRGSAVFPASDLLGPDTSLIYNDWYPALRSGALRGRKMSTAMLLGIPLVLGRKEDGSIFAMREVAPTAASRSPADGSMAARSHANTTDGSSSPSPASAWRFPP